MKEGLIFKVSDSTRTKELVGHAIFLAYQGAGGTTGLGALQSAPESTPESEILRGVIHEEPKPWRDNWSEAYVDYLRGRMCKVGFEYKDADGLVRVRTDTPRADYQGWSNTIPQNPSAQIIHRGRKFPSYLALIEAAAADLGLKLTPVQSEVMSPTS